MQVWPQASVVRPAVAIVTYLLSDNLKTGETSGEEYCQVAVLWVKSEVHKIWGRSNGTK